MAPAELGVAHDLLQFLVEEGVAARPVDLAAGRGEVEVDELREGMLDGLLPRTVVVVLRSAGGHSGLLRREAEMLSGNMTKENACDRASLLH